MLGWLTTTDHKRIGILYFFTTLVLFGIGGAEALLMRTQLAAPNSALVSPATYDELFTLHGLTMIFFFVIPMTTGAFGNYLIPLMIGARDMAFPRLNALGYWVFLASRVFLYAASRSGRRPTPAGSTTCRSRAARTTRAQHRLLRLGVIFNSIASTLTARAVHRHDLQAARARHVVQPHAAVPVRPARGRRSGCSSRCRR